MQGSNTLYEEGDDADEDLALNLPLLLASCPAGGVIDGSEITIEDFTQDLTVSFNHCTIPHYTTIFARTCINVLVNEVDLSFVSLI